MVKRRRPPRQVVRSRQPHSDPAAKVSAIPQLATGLAVALLVATLVAAAASDAASAARRATTCLS
jgi:hypothetical protein